MIFTPGTYQHRHDDDYISHWLSAWQSSKVWAVKTVLKMKIELLTENNKL